MIIRHFIGLNKVRYHSIVGIFGDSGFITVKNGFNSRIDFVSSFYFDMLIAAKQIDKSHQHPLIKLIVIHNQRYNWIYYSDCSVEPVFVEFFQPNNL